MGDFPSYFHIIYFIQDNQNYILIPQNPFEKLSDMIYHFVCINIVVKQNVILYLLRHLKNIFINYKKVSKSFKTFQNCDWQDRFKSPL